MLFAMLFPGQGSQSPGMLDALAARYSCVQATFDEASALLGEDLWRLVTEGPAEQLARTERTQPAMLAAGVACFRAWQLEQGADPTLVSGHSLGEFSALVCAGALEFAPALRLVRRRAELMQRAVPEGQGAMAAVLGLDDQQIEALCRDTAGAEVVEPVNYNAPGQVVIAGHAAAVQRALQAARERGARRTLPLPISVPAHCRLMQGAARAFEAALAEVSVSSPRVAYLSAVDAQLHAEPQDIRALLGRQLAASVRWTDTVTAVAARLTSGGEETALLLECGPGKVLTGLNRRIARAAQCLAVEDPESLRTALAASRAGGVHA